MNLPSTPGSVLPCPLAMSVVEDAILRWAFVLLQPDWPFALPVPMAFPGMLSSLLMGHHSWPAFSALRTAFPAHLLPLRALLVCK